jgi:uncharacterized protein (DUF697 family)
MATKKRMPNNPLESANRDQQREEGIEDIIFANESDPKGKPDEAAACEVAEPTTAAVVKPTQDKKSHAARSVIRRNSIISAVTGLIPVPFLDVTACAAVQLEMLSEISKIYGVAFRKELGKKLLATLIGTGIPAVAAKPLSSALKFIPLIGTLHGVLLLSNGAITYAVGMTFVMHFETGGTLLDFNPEKLQEYFKTQYAKGLNMI